LKTKYLPVIVSGFGAGVIAIVPFLNSMACCLVIPAAAYLSLFLDVKLNHTPPFMISAGKGALFGLLTGLIAALFATGFDIFVTLITRSNELMQAIGQLPNILSGLPLDVKIKEEIMTVFESLRKDIMDDGFSALYTVLIFMNNLISFTIFGLVGGLIGSQIIKSQNKRAG